MALHSANQAVATSWTQILLIYICGVVAAGQLGLVPPLVPALQSDLDIALTTAGATISVVTLVGAGLGLPAGRWAARIGHAHALGIGLLTMALAAALCALAPDGLTLLAARGLAGVGYLLLVIAAPSLMVRAAAPRDQPMALALWGTFVPAGMAVAQAVAGDLVLQLGWRAVFWIDAVVLLGTLIGANLVIARDRPASINEFPPPVLRNPAAVRTSITLFCFALVFLAVAGLLPAYLVDIHGYSAAEAGRIVAITTAGGIVGSLAAGWRMRGGASPQLLGAVGLLVSSAATWLVFNATLPDALVIAGATAAFVVGGVVPAAVFALVPRLAPDPAVIGPMNGLIAQLGSLGSLLGPPLVAAWVTSLGWSAAPVLLLVVAVVGAWCLIGATFRPGA